MACTLANQAARAKVVYMLTMGEGERTPGAESD